MRRTIVTMLLIVLGVAGPLAAQQTTGNINGRLVDAQGSAVPGVTVTAKNTQTGLTRTETSDGEGVYRLTALPVGIYDITAELSGFSKVENKGIVVNVGQTIDVNMGLKVASMSETVTVTGESPLIETSSSSVGGVVDIRRIESLPLNGRQFANLAATIPGVGLGFHSDPTKSTQYAPQINGGAGRNVNYQIDGGDNNDDTVGGLLQAYPLEAIQEFNFVTQRFKAEYGRSNGGVMNIVTKSGTNNYSGSFFESFRDKSMNAKTETEKIANVDKQDYRRNQFGGSFGGPIARDKAHFFGAVERTQQDTTQTVNTKGLFPTLDGSYTVPYRENLVTGKVTASLNASQYLSVRYGYNKNTQPYNPAGASATQDNWGDSVNKFNSINVNHNWVLPGQRLNEFIFQYADFSNNIASRSSAPNETFPNGVQTGANVNTPQTTAAEEVPVPRRLLLARLRHGRPRPRLQGRRELHQRAAPVHHVQHRQGRDLQHAPDQRREWADPDCHGQRRRFVGEHPDEAVRHLRPGRLAPDITPDAEPRPPLRHRRRLPVRPVEEPELRGGRGRREGWPADEHQGPGEHGACRRRTTRTTSSRVSVAPTTCSGNGKDVIRAGWGIYTDFGYTNSNVLFAASDATGSGFGQVFNVDVPTGIRNPDGSFYRAGQPLSNIQSQNQVTPGAVPLFGQWVDPRLQQPWTRQDQRRLVARADAQHDRQRRLRSARSAAISTSVRASTSASPARRIRRLAALVPTLTPNVDGHASGGQPRPQRVQRADPVRPPSPVPRPRLHRVLHAVGRARARSATPPTS